jgi:hypothetical protein
MTIYEWLQSARGELLTAGALGAVVSVAMEYTGVLPAIRKIAVGSISALYLAPLAVPLLSSALGAISIPTENAAGVAGFLVGIGNIIIIEIILKAFRLRRDEMTMQRQQPPAAGSDTGGGEA